jgi:hypothetical protein
MIGLQILSRCGKKHIVVPGLSSVSVTGSRCFYCPLPFEDMKTMQDALIAFQYRDPKCNIRSLLVSRLWTLLGYFSSAVLRLWRWPPLA